MKSTNIKDYKFFALTVCILVGSNIGNAQDPVPSRYNSIKKEVMRVSGIKNETDYSAMAESNRMTSVRYNDGLGRPLANVSVKASQTQQDIVQLYAYDPLGRIDTVFLPYMSPTNTGEMTRRGASVLNLKSFYLNTADKTADDALPFGANVYEKSPVPYLKEKGAPGSDWQPGNNHTVRTTTRANATSEIRRWYSNLSSPGYYTAGTLLVTEMTDENGYKTITVTDKFGNVLQQHVEADASVLQKTLYIYDDLNRLQYVIQPKGVQALGSNTVISTTIINQYAFSYVYDERNRLVEKKSPDAAPIYYCYDPLDRLILVQDGNLRAQSKWLFMKYDKRQRVIQNGFYLNSTYTTRSTVQQNLLDALPYTSGETYYEYRLSGGAHGYSNQSFPQSNTEIIHVTYYDTYDLDANGTDDFSYTAQGLANEGAQFKTVGQLTASKSLVMGTTNWITNYTFYDKYGHVIQQRSNNHLSSIIDNLTTAVYNFDGTVNTLKNYHKAVTGQEVTLIQRSEYDHAGRVKKVYQKINTDPEVLIAIYEYNEIGQRVDKKLNGPDNAYLQSVDYRYTIRGWIKSINNSQLGTGSNNDDLNDLFGLELLYNTAETGLNDQAGDKIFYNGNISAVKWGLQADGVTGISDKRSYKFDYDRASRLKSAKYQTYKQSNSTWTGETGAYNEVIAYDFDGNISTLMRNRSQKGSTAFSIASEVMDNMTYTYSGNSLSKVEDASGNVNGFKNGANIATEYTYNTNGDLTADKNKGIDSVHYNLLDKVSRIKFSDGRVVTYLYDASGIKLRMNSYQGTTLQSTTDYIKGFQYENAVMSFFGSPEGRVVRKPSGQFEYQFALADHQGNVRAIYGTPFETSNLITNADATSTTGFSGAQNVTLTALTQNSQSYIRIQSNQSTGKPGVYVSPALTVKAGEKYTLKVLGYRGSAKTAYLYVSSNAGDLLWPGALLPQGLDNEGWISSDVVIPAGVTQIQVGVLWDIGVVSGDQIFINKVGLYRHTDDDYQATFETASQATESVTFSNYTVGKINTSGVYSRTGTAAYRLTASTQISGEIIGPAKSIRVYPGDVINMEVYGKYLASTGTGNTMSSSFVTAILGAFSLSPTGATADAYASVNNLFNAGPVIGSAGFAYDGGAPKAFLNYILFDDNFVPYDFGYDQIGSSGAMPGGTADKMSLTARVKKPGYIYTYLSNENSTITEVYFDDFSIKHVKSPLVQYNEYYPFGMQTSNTFTRTDATANKYLYNVGSELNSNTGWYETFFRGYDAALGRFLSVDPKADSYADNSPYHYGLNNPVNFSDPFGADATNFVYDLWNQTPDGWKGYYQVTDGTVTSWSAYNPATGEYGYSSNFGNGEAVWNPYFKEDDNGVITGAWMSLRSYEGLVFWMNKHSDPAVEVSRINQQSNGGSAKFEILYASDHLDWFKETISYPSKMNSGRAPDPPMIIENAVLMRYDKKGVLISIEGAQRKLVDGKEVGRYDLYISPWMGSWMLDAISYHLYGPLGPKDSMEMQVMTKYLDFIFSPNPEQQKNANVVTGPHR
jgi:RHS repeat-associated protein